jgi:uracil-DNA glycosylase family 4
MRAAISPTPSAEAPRDCPFCPRLVALRHELRRDFPDWWNAPVPAFGEAGAWLAICGLAPGRKGANRTGRPFTGDDSGRLLFATLGALRLTEGGDGESAGDGLRLRGIAILNAVKCVPPGNKPLPAEIAACAVYLRSGLASLAGLTTIVALGRIAHDAVVRASGGRLSLHAFAHGAEHRLPDGRILIDCYHCSRLNQNVGRLTAKMLDSVFARAIALRPAVYESLMSHDYSRK